MCYPNLRTVKTSPRKPYPRSNLRLCVYILSEGSRLSYTPISSFLEYVYVIFPRYRDTITMSPLSSNNTNSLTHQTPSQVHSYKSFHRVFLIVSLIDLLDIKIFLFFRFPLNLSFLWSQGTMWPLFVSCFFPLQP